METTLSDERAACLFVISSIPCIRHFTNSIGHAANVARQPVSPPAKALWNKVIFSDVSIPRVFRTISCFKNRGIILI